MGTIQAQTEGLDLVVEGEAVQISDEEKLQRVAGKYNAKYSQPFTAILFGLVASVAYMRWKVKSISPRKVA